MKLESQRYGKARVRVMKILRNAEVHTVKELDVEVSLEGDFESAYTVGDNSLVVPTDTMKNTVNVMAYRHLGVESERFVALLAKHFVEKYPQVHVATVSTRERIWDRLSVDGQPHPHSFVHGCPATPTVRAQFDGKASRLESGIEGLLILKSAGSGFVGYPRCGYTTLPEMTDRIFATSLTSVWEWEGEPADYQVANTAILDSFRKPFAENYSPSVQATLFEMGAAALESCPEIGALRLTMPNKHCNRIDLSPFGIENGNVLFVPTDEPHGQIDARVVR